MKKSRPKQKLHIEQFHLYEMSRIGKSRERKQTSGCQRLGRKGDGKRRFKTSFGMGPHLGWMKIF